ncbi:MAG: hypothetical protein ACREDS_15580, partial [Limisphaerales bacterium]
ARAERFAHVLTTETLPSLLTRAMNGGFVVAQSFLILGNALTKIWPTSTPLKSPRAVRTNARTFAVSKA